MGFLSPKPPPPPPPLAPIPTREDPAVAAKKEDSRLAMARRKGRKSSILTSPLGATDTPEVSRKALLGAPTAVG